MDGSHTESLGHRPWATAPESMPSAEASSAPAVPFTGFGQPPAVIAKVSLRARFAPLSALPPERRLPARRSEQPTPSPAPLSNPTAPTPRQLPGVAPVGKSVARTVKQIGFNCPSCLAILIIKQPENYDGQAAPCPSCGVVILPPRIAPASPFTLMAPPSAAPSPHALPTSSEPFPVAPRPDPRIPKPGLPGARKLAQAALF
jgi:hypothetical protein